MSLVGLVSSWDLLGAFLRPLGVLVWATRPLCGGRFSSPVLVWYMGNSVIVCV